MRKIAIANEVIRLVILLPVICFLSCASCGRKMILAEEGSWWTDGYYIFEVVKSTPDSLLMECRTEYERGMVVVVARGEDGGWYIDGAGGFGSHQSPVRKAVVSGDSELLFADDADARGTGKELLIAYYPKDADDYLYFEKEEDLRAGKPMEVLERFDGDISAYTLKVVHRLLTGIYTDKEDTARVWTFLPDGTVSLYVGEAPKPYHVESDYRSLTNVILLPDGERWEFLLDGHCLFLSAVRWNEEYRFWQADTVAAHTMGYHPNLSWLQEQLFCRPMKDFLQNEWQEELENYARKSDNGFVRLNAAVIAASRNEGSL